MAAVVVANIVVFLNGMNLGDQIGTFEQKISQLKEENIDLEKKVFDAQSFTYATSMASAMNFTKKSTPVYIDNLVYAKN